jgi:hypothetical protein
LFGKQLVVLIVNFEFGIVQVERSENLVLFKNEVADDDAVMFGSYIEGVPSLVALRRKCI